MQNCFIHHDTGFSCRNFVCFLAFYRIISILLGVIFAACFHNVPESLMRMIAEVHVSIVGLAAVLFLPFTLSIVAVSFSKQWIIYLISVYHGFSCGFCIYNLLVSYYDAAWLIALMVAFSANLGQISLILFWIRCMNHSNHCWKRDAIMCFLLLILIGCLDYFVISPFLITIL